MKSVSAEITKSQGYRCSIELAKATDLAAQIHGFENKNSLMRGMCRTNLLHPDVMHFAYESEQLSPKRQLCLDAAIHWQIRTRSVPHRVICAIFQEALRGDLKKGRQAARKLIHRLLDAHEKAEPTVVRELLE